MVKTNHLILVALVVVIAMLASLMTMLAMKADPWASLEPAAASGGASSGEELVVVPVQVTQNEEVLAVFSKYEARPLVEGAPGGPQWSMVVYQMEGREKVKVLSARRIHNDFMMPVYQLAREDERRESETNPYNLARRAADQGE